MESLRHPVLDIGFLPDDKKEKNSETETLTGLKEDTQRMFDIINRFLREYAEQIKYINNRTEIFSITKDYIRGQYNKSKKIILGLHKRLHQQLDKDLDISADFAKNYRAWLYKKYKQLSIAHSEKNDGPSFMVRNLRLVSRVGPDENQVNQVVFSIIQRSGVNVRTENLPVIFCRQNQPKKRIALKSRKRIPKIVLLSGEGVHLFSTSIPLKLKYAVNKPLLDLDLLEKNRQGCY
ncbi:MAG: hypothetical protein IPH18_07405 [Chitinophagaceae bacterium]|nr:hypothetical protein [Chitinophagaceae bacterium]